MKTLGIISLVFVMVSPSLLLGGPLVNGEFIHPDPEKWGDDPTQELEGWLYNDGVWHSPIDFFGVWHIGIGADGNGIARMQDALPTPENTNILYQDFDVSSSTREIRFQFKPVIEINGVPTTTDDFKVSLWSLDGGGNLVQAVLAYDEIGFLYHKSFGPDPQIPDEMAEGVEIETLTGTDASGEFVYYEVTIPVDYSGPVRLTFSLEHSDNHIYSVIEVDNVVVVESAIAAVAYDGDTLLSTNGAETATAALTANLLDADGALVDITGEPVQFVISAEMMTPTIVETVSVGGIATVGVPLVPGIYTIDVVVPNYSDITASAALVVYNPAWGFVAGAGSILPAADGLNTNPNVRGLFGFIAGYCGGIPKGFVEFLNMDGSFHLKSCTIQQLVITYSKISYFEGWAFANGETGWWYSVKVVDNGRTGRSDLFEIRAWEPGADLNGNPTFRAAGLLRDGNIQVYHW